MPYTVCIGHLSIMRFSCSLSYLGMGQKTLLGCGSYKTELKTTDLAGLLWGKVASLDLTIPDELEVLICIQSWGITISATSSLNMLIYRKYFDAGDAV